MVMQIRHISDVENRPTFAVAHSGKQAEATCLPSPREFPVGNAGANLQEELRRYLETYLELPVHEFRTRAVETQTALSAWGKACFDALFHGRARDWYRDAWREGIESVQIEIVSDDPQVLSWPWEALESPDDGILSLHCRVERRLDGIGDVRPLSDDLPRDRLNILYIIARPSGDNDVAYQTLARPLIDFVKEKGWPAHIDVLRPPTFDQLKAVLEENPNFYHVVHFDGHGGFGDFSAQDRFAGQSGVLAFETDAAEAKAELVKASVLGELLRDHDIPVMVLNACQSAAMGQEDPFAPVAVSLLKAGIRGVVAMSYSLWVSGAEAFVPEFYRRLFQDGDVAKAMRAGRQAMYRRQERDTLYGKVDFHDWVVPVLYAQEAEGALPKLQPGAKKESALSGSDYQLGAHGFIGRDRFIRRLERAIRREPAGILIYGMAGEGKTTLARGFLRWLEDTNGLGEGALWLSFENIHGGEYVIDHVLGTLAGTQALALPTEEKLALATRILREHQFFLVWDNFESASGIAGTEVSALLTEDDRALLRRLLHGLRGGMTKVLITSRAPEKWLPATDCYRLPLGGLSGDELWQYCNAVVADLGLTIDRGDETYRKLLEKLGGNPLATRAILLRLEERSAEALLAEIEEELLGLGDDEMARIQAALAVFGKGLDAAFDPVLRLLGLHEQFADADFIEAMLEEEADEAAPMAACFAALESAGLCGHMGINIYRLHPALRANLSRTRPAEEADQRAFVDVMGRLASVYTPKELHEQRGAFSLFGASFHRALTLAETLDIRGHVLALTQGLAAYAQNVRDFGEAERLYTRFSQRASEYGNLSFEAGAYHQLGMVAQERRDFDAAERWYEKALEIELKQGDEHDAASTYHNLGAVAQERRDFDTAERWYEKVLEIKLEQGDEHGAAQTYHQLGIVAQERHNLDAAEKWYAKSLKIKLKQGNEHGAANTYHQLGIVAVKRRDFEAAEKWCKKSLEIFLTQGNEHGAASTYHQLGMVAQERRDFEAAERWYKKALEIELKQGDEYGAASAYHQLGMVAEDRRDFDAAERWYTKSLEIMLKLGNEHVAAIPYHQQEKMDKAQALYEKALAIFERFHDEYNQGLVVRSLARLQEQRKGGTPHA